MGGTGSLEAEAQYPTPLQEIINAIPAQKRNDPHLQRTFRAVSQRIAAASPADSGQFAQLREQLEKYLPRTVPNREDRIESTARKLNDLGVKAIDLPGLITTSRIRDAFRHWTTVLRSGLSFLPAAGTGLGLAITPAYDRTQYSAARADDVAERNIYIAYGLGIAMMGIGGQAAARIVVDGELGPKYNKPAPVERDGKSVPYAELTRAKVAKGNEFWPFAVGHAIVGSGALELGPVWTSGAFVGSTFCSSVTTAASSAIIDEALPPEGMDYAWLDASTAEKATAMQHAIEHLKESSVVALGGYAKDFVAGVKSTVGCPDNAAIKGTFFRFIAAVVATLPRLLYASTKNEHDKAMFGLIAGLWIGLTWGWLGDALFQKVEKTKPASRQDVAGVVPPTGRAGLDPAPDEIA